MPIKSLSKRLPIAGKVKLGRAGGEQNGRKQSPVKFDHFEITGLERDANDALVPDRELLEQLVSSDMVKTCGGKIAGCKRSEELARLLDLPILADRGLPRQIPIVLPYDDLDLNLQYDLGWFRGTTLYCKGDGETAQRRVTLKNDKGEDYFGPFAAHAGPCQSGGCPDFGEGADKKRRCGPHGRLLFMLGIQQIVGQAYTFETTSWNSIVNLVNTLEQIREITGGVLQYVPLYLECGWQTISRQGGSARHMIAKLAYRGTPLELVQQVRGMLQLRAPMVQEIRRLEASLSRDWNPTADDVREIRAEFDLEAAATEPAARAIEPVAPRTPADAPAPLEPEVLDAGCAHENQEQDETGRWVCKYCGLLDPPVPGTAAGAPADAETAPTEAQAENGPIGNEQLQQLWAAIQKRTEEAFGGKAKATKENRKRVLDAVLMKAGLKSVGEIQRSRFAEVLGLAEVIEL